jgi:hypothetical protein
MKNLKIHLSMFTLINGTFCEYRRSVVQDSSELLACLMIELGEDFKVNGCSFHSVKGERKIHGSGITAQHIKEMKDKKEQGLRPCRL